MYVVFNEKKILKIQKFEKNESKFRNEIKNAFSRWFAWKNGNQMKISKEKQLCKIKLVAKKIKTLLKCVCIHKFQIRHEFNRK